MTQEFVTLPREVVEQAVEALFCMDSEEGSTAYKNELEAIKKLRAALEHQQNHVPDAGNMVPAGWRLVPVEPTEKMVDMGRGLSSFPNGVYRAMLSAAPQPPTVEKSSAVQQPQSNQPAMTPIAQRKLDSLLTDGYTISGYSVCHEQKHQHGFVTGAGLVGWWKPEGMEYPQPQGEQESAYLLRDLAADIGLNAMDLISAIRDAGLGDYSINMRLPARVCVAMCKRFADVGRRPVARVAGTGHLGGHFDWCVPGNQGVPRGTPLYTSPQPKHEPLTDEQIGKIGREHEKFSKEGSEWFDRWTFARAIEAAHNIK